VRLLSRGPDETFNLGQRLGSLLKDGDAVALFGELGSGKTTFVKGVASAFYIPEREITSASFTIISEHSGRIKIDGEEGVKEIPFYHIDLYRLKGKDMDSIGLDEYIGKGVSVIEWADRLEEYPFMIKVYFKIIDTDEREIIIEGLDEKDWHNRQVR